MLEAGEVETVTALTAGVMTIIFGLVHPSAVRVRGWPRHQRLRRLLIRGRAGDLAEAMALVAINGLIINAARCTGLEV